MENLWVVCFVGSTQGQSRKQRNQYRHQAKFQSVPPRLLATNDNCQHKRGRTTIFRPAASNTGCPKYAISFSPHRRYLKFALLRSTGKKGEK